MYTGLSSLTRILAVQMMSLALGNDRICAATKHIAIGEAHWMPADDWRSQATLGVDFGSGDPSCRVANLASFRALSQPPEHERSELRKMSHSMHAKKLGAAIAATLAVVTCVAAATVQASSLRDALEKAPAKLIESPTGYAAYFLDFDALRAVSPSQPTAPSESRVHDPFSTKTLSAFVQDTPDQWAHYTGLQGNELASILITPGSPDDLESEVVRWRFTQPGYATTFLQGLQKRGFREVNGEWRNGKPDNLAPEKDDLWDPLLGVAGRTHIVKKSGADILQTGNSHANGAVPDKQHSLALFPPVRTALDVLEKSTQNASVPQVYVASLPLWAVADSPLMTAFLQAIKNNSSHIDVPKPSNNKLGMPPSLGTLMADVHWEQPARHGVMFVFAYDDCATAKQAGATFINRWRHNKSSPSVDATSALVQTDQACTAVVTVSRPDSEIPPNTRRLVNPILRYIMTAIQRREFTPLSAE